MQQNLLDTHTFIWFVEGSNQLSAKARKEIETPDAINFVSIVTLWEIAVKVSLNKLELKTPFYQINEQIQNNGFKILPIAFQDTITVSELPFHHRDPFDRIIIAQAFRNNLTILSKDELFSLYSVKVIW